MKVLFDCVLTAKDPAKCSTTWQFFYMAEKLLELDPNLYIYWGVPNDYLGDEFYPKNERIKYFPISYSVDRMKEYQRLQPEMIKAISAHGDFWDWDVLITVRSPLVAQMRTIGNSVRSTGIEKLRKIVVIEDMMVCSKKPTVALSSKVTQDMQLLVSYLASDVVVIPAFHEKKWALELAREYLSFSQVRELGKKLLEVSHVTLGIYDYGLKKELYKKGDIFNLAFVGRLEKVDNKLAYINKVFENQFILGKNRVNAFVCTVTPNEKIFDTEIFPILHPKRDEFWNICKTGMDLCIGYTVDTELNLSKLEPLLFGVPLIINKADWSIGMLGEDYPFFCNNETECYGWIEKFKNDYEGMYAIFSEWYENWFIPTYKEREEKAGMYNVIFKEITSFRENLSVLSEARRDNIVVKGLAKVDWGNGLSIFDAIKQAHVDDVGAMKSKVNKDQFNDLGLVWATDFKAYRDTLIHYYGFEDAGVETGFLRRIKND